ncbi:MAG: alpha/beta hydrolase-fold protein [Chloroflexota bacterium]|nr:alpha/beta hydrolase-fold protein [Chloroflexota bacterium]
MKREYHRWWSPSLQRDMELLIFGHAGARVLVFPTSKGRFYEWEDRGMIGAMSWQISQGWFQFYCIDSVDAESWYNYGAHPGYRPFRHNQYEQYILNEVVPLMWRINPTPYLITTGASFGAYHAMNIALRHPNTFQRVLGLSGIYDISSWVHGHHDNNVYFNNPVDYVKSAHDSHQLHQLRQLNIIMAVGEHDPNIGHNRYFSDLLWDKGIWHAFRIWDGWAHDWPWWRQMLQQYIGGSD